MSTAADTTLSRLHKTSSPEETIEGVRVGRVARINDSGQPLVDFSGNQRGPLAARFTGSQ